MVMPFCAGGELFSVVAERGGLSEDNARHIFRDLLAGMDFLHDLQICHRSDTINAAAILIYTWSSYVYICTHHHTYEEKGCVPPALTYVLL